MIGSVIRDIFYALNLIFEEFEMPIVAFML